MRPECSSQRRLISAGMAAVGLAIIAVALSGCGMAPGSEPLGGNTKDGFSATDEKCFGLARQYNQGDGSIHRIGFTSGIYQYCIVHDATCGIEYYLPRYTNASPTSTHINFYDATYSPRHSTCPAGRDFDVTLTTSGNQLTVDYGNGGRTYTR